ncbi:MAG: hypothetical protein R8K20_00645, partial [Gallionellaceae bacterium]
QKKVTKEKATPVCRPSGPLRCSTGQAAAELAALKHNQRLGWRRLPALVDWLCRASSPKSPDPPALLGGAQGKVKRKSKA